MGVGVYWGYIGIIGYIGAISGLLGILGLCWENGKENGNYYSIIGLIVSTLYVGVERRRCKIYTSPGDVLEPGCRFGSWLRAVGSDVFFYRARGSRYRFKDHRFGFDVVWSLASGSLSVQPPFLRLLSHLNIGCFLFERVAVAMYYELVRPRV